MEDTDRTKISNFLRNNQELKRLYREHQELESRLTRLGQRAYLTAAEEQEEKLLKKVKLRGVDRMLTIVEHVEKAA
jgi:uncharacterized protein YdcH (DUF465 family)